jgi:hypothetical protein
VWASWTSFLFLIPCEEWSKAEDFLVVDGPELLRIRGSTVPSLLLEFCTFLNINDVERLEC